MRLLSLWLGVVASVLFVSWDVSWDTGRQARQLGKLRVIRNPREEE